MMTLRKAVFTITTGADLQATDDANLSGYAGTRGAWLEFVTIDDSQASVSGFASVGIYQVDTDDDANSTELERVQLFQLDGPIDSGGPNSLTKYFPRFTSGTDTDSKTVHPLDGDTSTFDAARQLIYSRNVRCRLEFKPGITPVAGDVYTVTMWYETAGDYRF
jgi:hypothetical protein